MNNKLFELNKNNFSQRYCMNTDRLVTIYDKDNHRFTRSLY